MFPAGKTNQNFLACWTLVSSFVFFQFGVKTELDTLKVSWGHPCPRLLMKQPWVREEPGAERYETGGEQGLVS